MSEKVEKNSEAQSFEKLKLVISEEQKESLKQYLEKGLVLLFSFGMFEQRLVGWNGHATINRSGITSQQLTIDQAVRICIDYTETIGSAVNGRYVKSFHNYVRYHITGSYGLQFSDIRAAYEAGEARGKYLENKSLPQAPDYDEWLNKAHSDRIF